MTAKKKNDKSKSKTPPAPATDDAAPVDRPRAIPFGNKADARSPRKEQKTWEDVEPDVIDGMTPG